MMYCKMSMKNIQLFEAFLVERKERRGGSETIFISFWVDIHNQWTIRVMYFEFGTDI
jgi:hypothetical protein